MIIDPLTRQVMGCEMEIRWDLQPRNRFVP
jgi:hypothetical protein